MKIKFSFLILALFISMAVFFYACSKENAAPNNATAGKGGSLAKFTVSGNYLYAVDSHTLYAFSLSDVKKPLLVSSIPFNFDIETIYPHEKNLFLGTRTGLYIYSIDTPAHPRLVGQARHARSCDPVVVNDSVAFVTLRSSSFCGPATSGLYVHDIKNLFQPILKKLIELPDPIGLALQDSVLYVCCGGAGLKVFNINNPYNPTMITSLSDGEFVDVIPYNKVLITYTSKGIVLYDISNPALPLLIRKIL